MGRIGPRRDLAEQVRRRSRTDHRERQGTHGICGATGSTGTACRGGARGCSQARGSVQAPTSTSEHRAAHPGVRQAAGRSPGADGCHDGDGDSHRHGSGTHGADGQQGYMEMQVRPDGRLLYMVPNCSRPSDVPNSIRYNPSRPWLTPRAELVPRLQRI